MKPKERSAVAFKIPTAEESRKLVGEVVETTTYHPQKEPKKDRDGMPVVKPEPDDPDDE